MMLAITTLSAGWQTFLYAAAMALLGLHGVGLKEGSGRLRLDASIWGGSFVLV
jgi:hypothetical protein